MPRPTQAVINPAAISENINQIKKLLGKCVLMPVVKANAYGHGLAQIYTGLLDSDALAILEIDGAACLRRLGWSKPIVLIEGCFDQADLTRAIDLRCDWVVHHAGQLEQLEVLSQRHLAYKPRIYLKLNTGMNRLGFQIHEAQAAIAWLDQFVSKYEWPVPVLMTHFANADQPALCQRRPFVVEQYNSLMCLKPKYWQSSLGNSAGILNFPELVGDIVRPGIAIYGATPGPNAAAHYGLKAAMEFSSKIISIQTLKAGDSVGYGSRWQAVGCQSTRIAVVACGYADGYPRQAPDGTPTFVHGQVAPIVGRVSMDMMTINISHVPNAKVGSVVELWGDNVSVDDVAERCGTIAYELLCAISPRVTFHVISKD